MGITGGGGDKTGPINLTDFPMLTTRREDGRVKQTVSLTDLISGDGGWEVGALVLLGMKRFDSVKRGNGVGREPIKYQPILV